MHKSVMEMEESSILELKDMLRGELIRPGDEAYDSARRVFNAMIDKSPGLIVRCAGAADVLRVVNFARRNEVLVAVRGGGHHVTGNAVCDGGIVIDLSMMKGLRIDPDAQIARVGPGVTWGELNHDLQAFGLGASGGYVSITGVSGLTLGGGFGWLVRKHGLALDNLRSVDVVTAENGLVEASPTKNEDLFWGMRGAGANFGVVTDFEFQVHQVGTVLAGALIYPIARAPEVLRMFREHVADAPEELTWGALLFTIPEGPMFPPQIHGAPVIVLAVCYAGSLAEGEKFLRSLRQTVPPLADTVQPMEYSAAQTSADFIWPPGNRQYWKSSFLLDLPDEAIDTILEHFARVPSPQTVIVLDHNGGGAIERVAADETAFGHRDWTYNFLITSAWSKESDDRKNLEWTSELWTAMQPFLANAVYVNYTGDQSDDVIGRAYLPGSLKKLTELKNKYDPTNLFRTNHNIKPQSGIDHAVR